MENEENRVRIRCNVARNKWAKRVSFICEIMFWWGALRQPQKHTPVHRFHLFRLKRKIFGVAVNQVQLLAIIANHATRYRAKVAVDRMQSFLHLLQK